MQVEPGKRVGSYVIEEPVGRGGMGVVYRGRHATLPRAVAIKSISPRGAHDLRRMRSRFEREAFVQAQLDHPGVVKVYDYVVSEQTYFIVMEYVEGRSLAQLIRQEGGPLEINRALDLFEQILSAIAYAHTFTYRDEHGATHHGIVHRDLKPPNIMVTPDDRVKVTDFGIVKLVGAAATDTSNVAYGSPRYVSPEQAGGEPVGQRSDIYSLGTILYEMLTGEPPFGGPSGSKDMTRTEILRAHREQQPRPPSELNTEVTPEIERVVLRALEKKPERRFASAADFLRALRRASGRDPSVADSAGASGHTSLKGGAGTGALGETTDEILQDAYHTQPISAGSCPECGAAAGAGDSVCATCGHDLTASPATADLARRDATARQARQGVKLFAAVGALSLLLISLVYFVRLRGLDSAREPKGAAVVVATPAPTTAAAPGRDEGVPAGPLALLGAAVKVDSTFDSYNTRPLTDGVTDVREIASMRFNQGNWVSAESPDAHWIELDFGGRARVTAVYLFWGFDRGRYMPSRRVELQVPDGGAGGWRAVSALDPGSNYDRAAFEFEPVTTARLRVFQPPQQGPSNRPFVMWVREVQAFGTKESRQ
ncbi:MAG TPA: protein kinase [Pyrinomonadaceae bacterium]|nr:protein kinase [Pyrinomonadaceae bacterium]